MWPFRRNPRIATYLNNQAVARAAANSFHGERSYIRFLLQFTETEAERVIDAYAHQPGPTRYDPIEERAEFATVFVEVERELKVLYPERRRGSCYRLWQKKKQLLQTRGIDWLSPAELNPFHRFD